MGIFRQAYINDNDEMMPYFYWLTTIGDIGIKTYTKMQSRFASPRDLFEASLEKINDSGVFSDKQKKHIAESRKNADIFKNYEKMLDDGIKLIVRESEQFPERLKEIPQSPVALFIKGDMSTVCTPLVSVIGARDCSFYGMQVAKRLGELFAENGICVVSGMARGIDSTAQEACVSAGGSSVAVLGGGVDIIYPKESEKLYRNLERCGAIVSEYPPGTNPLPQFFAQRNRIISGLSDVVCVLEAREKSGTMITVDAALEQGREVYALPGRITDSTSRGCNELIKQGAGAISDLDMLVMEITHNYSKRQVETDIGNITFNIEETRSEYEDDLLAEGLNETEKKIILGVDEDSFTPEQMAQILSVSAGDLFVNSMNLSLKKIFVNMGAGRFRLSDKGVKIRNKLMNI